MTPSGEATTGPPDLAPTRVALQTVAEHVLSAALHAATGKIGLQAVTEGFGTPEFPSDDGPRRLLVRRTDLVIVDDRGERSEPMTTVGKAAAFVGIEAGAPASVYTPATPLRPDEPLVFDRDAVRVIDDWYGLVDDALAAISASWADDDPATARLWPEHFDLATTVREVNYGGSPGDAGHPEPYLYVGPFSPPATDGDYWNEPFGASLGRTAIGSVADAVAFFVEGRRRLSA